MIKFFLILVVFVLTTETTFSQRYITKNAHIWFYSEAPLETIEAHNNNVNAALDIKTGDFVFKVLLKSFIFEKALMQEHFNENYVESDKFPTSIFKGKVLNVSSINFAKEGTYEADVSGELTIHGITKQVASSGTFTIKSGTIHGKSKFKIEIMDYGISIPGAVAGKIAEEVEINVDMIMKELKK